MEKVLIVLVSVLISVSIALPSYYGTGSEVEAKFENNYDDDYYFEDVEKVQEVVPVKEYVVQWIEHLVRQIFQEEKQRHARHHNHSGHRIHKHHKHAHHKHKLDSYDYPADQAASDSENGGNFENLGKFFNSTASDMFMSPWNTTLSELILNQSKNVTELPFLPTGTGHYATDGVLFPSEKNLTEELRKRYRAKTREQWKEELKKRILESVGRKIYSDTKNATVMEFPKNIDGDDKFNFNLTNIPLGILSKNPIVNLPKKDTVSNFDYIEKIQSFFPKCDIPRNTDSETWTDNSNMNLLFSINVSNIQEGYSLNIAKATLRLFKLTQNHSVHSVEIHSNKELPEIGNSIFLEKEDRQIRVSIYWYTRSLRKHRVKRRLSDSKMVNVYDSKIHANGGEWIEFNIRPAAKTWMKTGRNLGLGIVIEDQEGNILPADRYFKNIDCHNNNNNNNNQASQMSASVKPIPRPIFEAAALFAKTRHVNTETGDEGKRGSTEFKQSEPSNFNSFLFFPTIDLCTIELPINTEKSKISEIKKIACNFKEINFHTIDPIDLIDIFNNRGDASNLIKFNFDSSVVERVGNYDAKQIELGSNKEENTTELLQNDSPVDNELSPTATATKTYSNILQRLLANSKTAQSKPTNDHPYETPHNFHADPMFERIENPQIVMTNTQFLEILKHWEPSHVTEHDTVTDR